MCRNDKFSWRQNFFSTEWSLLVLWPAENDGNLSQSSRSAGLNSHVSTLKYRQECKLLQRYVPLFENVRCSYKKLCGNRTSSLQLITQLLAVALSQLQALSSHDGIEQPYMEYKGQVRCIQGVCVQFGVRINIIVDYVPTSGSSLPLDT
jgi:hypothetical protein